MKQKIRMGVLLACAAASFSLSAYEIAAWRGETVADVPPDFVELGEKPEGLSVRVGTLRSVKYALAPRQMQRGECYDRVEWGTDDGKGPRVIEIQVPADAKPGVYKYGMIDIRVVDRVLPPPRAWKYFLDLWQHPWAIARMANVEPFSWRHYRAMRPVYELLATAGQKTLTVSLMEMPWNHQCYDAYHSMIGRTRDASGKWHFDYTVFDEYVEFGRSCGLGPKIACYTLCSWGSQIQPGTPEYEDFWGDFIGDFAQHLKAKGWFDDTLIAMDERSPEQVRGVVDFIQKRAPGLRISMAGNRKPSDFKGIQIDVYSQVLFADCVTKSFLAEVAERRAKGLVTTGYVCCSPKFPNTFMSSQEGEAFWCGAGPVFLGLDGFLRWAWNSWPANPENDASYGNWAAGDTFLCYPDGVPSWRFLELRNGIIAAEKLRLLKEAGLFADEIARVTALYNVKDANENKTNFVRVREETLKLVNR